jgi:serine/threonine protein kinase
MLHLKYCRANTLRRLIYGVLECSCMLCWLAPLDFQAGTWESISKPARDLIGRMLTRDTSARISADEVLSKSMIDYEYIICGWVPL